MGGHCGHTVIPVGGADRDPVLGRRGDTPGNARGWGLLGALRECGRGLLDVGAPGAAGRAGSPASPQVCLPLTLLRPPDPQNMEKVAAPSVTLIVGCGVSSLTLLMLIIIYVSVWR